MPLRSFIRRSGLEEIAQQIRIWLRQAAVLPARRRALRKGSESPPGSPDWLIVKELQYGGMIRRIPRQQVSPRDPRTPAQLRYGGMSGGDRMLFHGYASMYARHLSPVLAAATPVTATELGILTGIGLAVWCDLFPNSRVIGLDIDLQHCRNNLANLRRLGAFRNNEPELYEFDQFIDNRDYLSSLLGEDRIGVCIDDGFHSEESILTTIQSVAPFLAPGFVYIVEDNPSVHRSIVALYPEWNLDRDGSLTVLSPRNAPKTSS